jgi:hypothetical protein
MKSYRRHFSTTYLSEVYDCNAVKNVDGLTAPQTLLSKPDLRPSLKDELGASLGV